MPDLLDLIRYENENSALDFKATQYRKEVHEALLKDVLAMANADVIGERHIVIGIKHQANGSREFVGIEPSEFVDAATYQELVRANIEPDLNIDYVSLEVDGKLLGVIRISGCDRQPYMMKKDFGSLRAGDAWVRKGSHQARMTRADFERVTARVAAGGPKDAELLVSLAADEKVTEIALPALAAGLQLPSDRAAAKIKALLRGREEQRQNPKLDAFGSGALTSAIMSPLFGGTPYELRSDEELRSNLEHVKKTYLEDDVYELYELHASKLNVYIQNVGTAYVEDAVVELRFPMTPGIRVAKRIHQKPDRTPLLLGGGLRTDFTAMFAHYPEVISRAGGIVARYELGDIKHHRVTPAFADALRVAFSRELVGQTVPLEFVILARNLPTPRQRLLSLRVVEPSVPTASA